MSGVTSIETEPPTQKSPINIWDTEEFPDLAVKKNSKSPVTDIKIKEPEQTKEPEKVFDMRRYKMVQLSLAQFGLTFDTLNWETLNNPKIISYAPHMYCVLRDYLMGNYSFK
jgi:hypothetical protein